MLFYFFSAEGTDAIFIGNAVNDDGNHYISRTVPMNQYTHVRIQQELTSYGLYRYSISFDDREIFTTINSNPRVYENALLYTSDHFYPAANIELEDVEFQSPLHEPCKSSFQPAKLQKKQCGGVYF